MAGKRRRESPAPGSARRSDLLSSLLGKRVCVPRRRRSTTIVSHIPGQGGAQDSPGHGATSTGVRGCERIDNPGERGGNSQAQDLRSERLALLRTKAESSKAMGPASDVQAEAGPSARMHALFGGDNNEEEEFAVMGLLRLCEAT